MTHAARVFPEAQDADTEQLRMSLQDYRTFWTSVTQLPQPA
jgi:hypothetical protein